MPLDTFFAPANDIGALSRYQLQDAAQQMADQANKRQYLADMYRTNAERYKAQQDAAARMFQTQAYRDVGMTDADVRRALGLGQIGVQQQQIGSTERIAGMPYLKMTPAQEAEIALKGRELGIYEKNPMLLHPNPRVEEDMYRNQNLQDMVARAAATANSNLQRRGGMPAITAEVAKAMDEYGHWYNPDVSGQGLFGSDAEKLAPLVVSGGAIPPNFATRDAIGAGRKYFNDIINSTTVGLEDFKPYLRFNAATGQWESMFGNAPSGGVPGPVTNALNPPAVVPTPPRTNAVPAGRVTIQPTNTLPNLPRVDQNALPRFRYTPNGGLVPVAPTNTPTSYFPVPGTPSAHDLAVTDGYPYTVPAGY